MRLLVEFRGFWRIGTGASLAGRVDMRCLRDTDGFPYVPGKSLKGILREALRDASRYGWGLVSPEDIFGKREVETGDAGHGGCLRVGDAVMDKADRAALRGDNGAISELFRIRRKTAMDDAGIAKTRSLRAEEVVIPLSLHAEIEPIRKTPDNWESGLERALVLITGIGGGRTRGLGRCRITREGDR